METKPQFTLRSTLVLIVVAVLLPLNGCMMVKSESDVLGEYALKVGKNNINLTISADKSFTERIMWQDGRTQTRYGKWNWAYEGIGFDRLWIPPAFAPQYILQADAAASENRQPKYTEPLYWHMRAERHWGTVVLPIFPDDDVQFKMVSHSLR